MAEHPTLTEAIDLAKSGKKAEARQLIDRLLTEDMNNAAAWTVMAQLVDDKEEAIFFIKQALRLNPDDDKAKRYLAHLEESDNPASSTPAAIEVRPAEIESDQNRESIRIVCPKCESQNLYSISLSKPNHSLQCPSCKTHFLTIFAIVRAKRSQGNKKENRRRFSIRIEYANGHEDLIEFLRAGYEDFELRSKDLANFSYMGDKVRVVQNLTINKYMTVSEPSCYLATYAFGANSGEVKILREFRDNVLLPHRLLASFVAVYYTFSSFAVKYLARNELFRYITIILVKVVVRLIK